MVFLAIGPGTEPQIMGFKVSPLRGVSESMHCRIGGIWIFCNSHDIVMIFAFLNFEHNCLIAFILLHNVGEG